MSIEDSYTRDRQKNWIDRISKEYGHSYSRIAKEVNVAQTTISRFMNDDQSSNALSARTEEKIAKRYFPDEKKALFATHHSPLTTHQVRSEENHLKSSQLNGSSEIVRIPEYGIEASAGPGCTVPNMENPLTFWEIPCESLYGVRAASLKHLAVITVAGDSMMPDYMPHERILVDMGDAKVTHDGVYVLWNGIGLVVKMVQIIPPRKNKGIALRIISKNPDYDSYDMEVDEVHITGRIVGKWLWK